MKVKFESNRDGGGYYCDVRMRVPHSYTATVGGKVIGLLVHRNFRWGYFAAIDGDGNEQWDFSRRLADADTLAELKDAVRRLQTV